MRIPNDADMEMAAAREAAGRLEAVARKGGRVLNPAIDYHAEALRGCADLAVQSWGSATADLVEMLWNDYGIVADLSRGDVSGFVFDALEVAGRRLDEAGL